VFPSPHPRAYHGYEAFTYPRIPDHPQQPRAPSTPRRPTSCRSAALQARSCRTHCLAHRRGFVARATRSRALSARRSCQRSPGRPPMS